MRADDRRECIPAARRRLCNEVAIDEILQTAPPLDVSAIGRQRPAIPWVITNS
jgi:hypothetical protein